MSDTSGASTFNLEIKDIVEEAFERCGSELRTGYDLRTARRSLNLLAIEWANRGINLWTIEQGQIDLVYNNPLYPLPVDTIDLLDQVIRRNDNTTNQIDINISRISVSTYAAIPNKTTTGLPIQVWVNRQSGQTNPAGATLSTTINASATTITVSSTANLAAAGFIKIGSEIIGYTNVSGNELQNCTRGQANTTAASHTSGADIYSANIPAIYVWPAPDSSTPYTFVYWRMRRVQNMGEGGTNVADIPFRFLPCLVAGLAYHLSLKIPDAMNRTEMLKLAYEEQWNIAAGEDREKASQRFVPRETYIGSGGY
jgi:hypothetical protein